MSVMLILSEPMETFVKEFGITAQELLLVASLVVGRPFNLMLKHRYLDFVKTLVSSDLDADKVDYVARDAYFAGIPIAADVDRLISQLATIEYPPPSAISGAAEVAGILPSGVAAVEMFIMTRSYLFDRIYQHPKVRAAERVLERLLAKRIIERIGEDQKPERYLEVIGEILYGETGDDGCLEAGRASSSTADNSIVRGIDSIVRRVLPRRALALSLRCTVGYDIAREKQPIVVSKPWNDLSDVLSQYPRDLEEKIVGLSAVGGDVVVIADAPRKVPLKENPEIYVREARKMDKLVTINQHFDAVQLSKAYEDVKKLAWIFTDVDDHTRVAAASAVVLCARFGWIPNDEGLRKAKIDPKEFWEAVGAIRTEREEAGEIELAVVADTLAPSREGLRLSTEMVLDYLPMGNDADARAAAKCIAERFEDSNLTRWHMADVEAALPILRILLEHSLSSVAGRARHQLSIVERDFQEEVIQFLRRDHSEMLEVDREHIGERGRVDIVVRPDAMVRERVAIELKSENLEFEEIVRAKIAQPFHYAADPKYCRVAILYCRFRSDQARRPASFLTVETAGDERAPLLVICIGQQVTRTSASEQREI